MRRTSQLFFVACCLALLTMLSCGNNRLAKTEAKDKQKLAQAAEAEPPKIVADEAVYKFGEVEQGQKIEHTFKLRNKGGSELVIDKATGS